MTYCARYSFMNFLSTLFERGFLEKLLLPFIELVLYVSNDAVESIGIAPKLDIVRVLCFPIIVWLWLCFDPLSHRFDSALWLVFSFILLW